MSRAVAPLLAAALALVGSLASTLFLFRSARDALDRVLEERLRGAGESAALLLTDGAKADAALGQLARANALDGASLLDRSLQVISDGQGRAGRRADLLRIDADRVAAAFAGRSFVGPGYSLGGLEVTTGYFPVHGRSAAVQAVLVLEAGESFLTARGDLDRAGAAAALLSLGAALALGFIAARWNEAERHRTEAARKAVRGEAMTRMAAMVAHEIRNPLGILRGTVELMRERAGAELPAWLDESQRDLLEEVDRLRRLTDDFLWLGSPDRPLALAPLDLAEVLTSAARRAEAVFRAVHVRCAFDSLPRVNGDAGRLLQVFGNLLGNASEAIGHGEVSLEAAAIDGVVRVRVHDDGPGLPQAVRERLFDPFMTTKSGGTGLGLTIAKMLVERHKGSLLLVEVDRPGTTFEVRLPIERG